MFKTLKTKVDNQFGVLSSRAEMYVVKLEKNELFDAYIQSLPEAERAEHMCNCCRHFLNQYGGIVTIHNGKLETVWDFETEAPYDKVPKALRDLVNSKVIDKLFLSDIQKLGTDFNHQRLENGEVIRWDHFFVTLPKDKVIRGSKTLDTIQGDFRATRDVFLRSLETLTQDASETVLGLISENNLYRGKEFESVVSNFLKHQKAYAKSDNKELYVWANFKDGGRVKNSAIGTLLEDLSEGKELSRAVASFESKVAPTNYKRPTSLVTGKMIEQAQATLVELGLTGSLARRHATIDDIPVSNLLFVNRDKKGDDVFALMKSETPVNTKSFVRAKELTLDDFLQNVVPTAVSLELLLENNNNFVSLVAPENTDSTNMFAWDNPISWTYQNNQTDAIKEKVKAAGGAVEGELRVSLEWFNYDDLDLHLVEPGGNEISFRNTRSPTSGYLDIDMNRSPSTRTPVENIAFQDKRLMREGVYKVFVNNWCKRENIDLGFNVQIECQGSVFDLSYSKAVSGDVVAATFKYTKANGISDFKTELSESFSQKEVNGVMTNRFQQVNMMMYSPNYWTNQIGNKHLFFILDGAKIDNTLRPFFNEYLKPSLQEHRKVFEILGSKLMVGVSENQLSGVGYSLTQKNQVIVRVNGVMFKVNI
jgi:hypothetical protein